MKKKMYWLLFLIPIVGLYLTPTIDMKCPIESIHPFVAVLMILYHLIFSLTLLIWGMS